MICRPFPAVNVRCPQDSFFHPFTVKCNLARNPGSSEVSGNNMFFLGMGFVGQFFAADLKSNGWMVSGSCTSAHKKRKLEEMGFEAYLFDADKPHPEILDIVKDHTHLLVSIPPIDGLGDPLLRDQGFVEKMLKNGRLRWLVYLSTTGVYGDCGGDLVNEDYPVKPSSEKMVGRLSAEKEWLSLGHNLGIAAHIFRAGGIYGPGRSAVDTIIKRLPLSMGQKTRLHKNYTSRVHVADICQALNASILRPSPGKIYNIVDDDPAPRIEVFKFAQNLVEEKFSRHGKQYLLPNVEEHHVERRHPMGEKRVSNARMKRELGVKLFYPTYRYGLQSIIDNIDPSYWEKLPGS